MNRSRLLEHKRQSLGEYVLCADELTKALERQADLDEVADLFERRGRCVRSLQRLDAALDTTSGDDPSSEIVALAALRSLLQRAADLDVQIEGQLEGRRHEMLADLRRARGGQRTLDGYRAGSAARPRVVDQVA